MRHICLDPAKRKIRETLWFCCNFFSSAAFKGPPHVCAWLICLETQRRLTFRFLSGAVFSMNVDTDRIRTKFHFQYSDSHLVPTQVVLLLFRSDR